MTERDNLLASIADTIKTFREGEIEEPTSAHVERWASQFTAANQLPFLREFDHVIRQTFFTVDKVKTFLSRLVSNPRLAGPNPAAFWAKTNVLRIQRDGQSQREMVRLFAESLNEQCGLSLAECGVEGGAYIYLDDVLFTGGRVATDLQIWIAEQAPDKAVVHVILMAMHTSGHYYTSSTRLRNAIATSGKDITVNFWYSIIQENQRNRKDNSNVLWPTVVPNDPAVQAYVESLIRYPLALRAPGGALGPFSSEAGRQVLEQEFLIAGVRIRSLTQTPRDFIRPLGYGNFGVGFGSLIATYRNCPNNCPLAMWWGDPAATHGALHWYPLLSRITYAAPENVFGHLAL